MKLHNISIHKSTGFSLIEILIVVGIFSLFISMGLMFSFSSYQGYIFHGEYVTTVNLLAKARNYAINNFNESDHGVRVEPNEYILFIGDTYNASDPTNKSYPRNTSLQFAGAEEIVFEQMSGSLKSCDGVSPCTMTFGYSGRSKTLTINEVGGIDW